MKLLHLLQTRSKESSPTKSIDIGGPLHDSAIGSIHYAAYSDESSNSSESESDAVIVKTMDLNEQNIYCCTTNNKRATIRGLDHSNVIFISNSKSEAKEWASTYRKEATVAKIAYIMGPEKLIRPNEFLNEALVGLIVSSVKVPHIVKTLDFWISDATGHILQEYGGVSMFKNMASLSFDEFKSVILQCLVTLSICQNEVAFKHHDLHLDNVFLTKLKKEHPLCKSDLWAYTLKKSDGQELAVHIKHCGTLAKIGDFGLASATDPESGSRLERADFHILDAGDPEWGQWTGQLENHMAYDALVLLSKFFLEEERSLCSSRQSAWARGAYDAIRARDPKIECSIIGRPLRGQDGGSMTIADILALPYFAEFHAAETKDLPLKLF
jgi:serine/threonine protein kinase